MLKKYSFLPFLAALSFIATTQAADIMTEIQSLNSQRMLFNDTQMKLNLLVNSLDNSAGADVKSKQAVVSVIRETVAMADNYSKSCDKIKERIQVKAQALVDGKMNKEIQNISKDLAGLKTTEESSGSEEYALIKKAIESKNRMQTCATLSSILSGALQSQAGGGQSEQ